MEDLVCQAECLETNLDSLISSIMVFEEIVDKLRDTGTSLEILQAEVDKHPIFDRINEKMSQLESMI